MSRPFHTRSKAHCPCIEVVPVQHTVAEFGTGSFGLSALVLSLSEGRGPSLVFLGLMVAASWIDPKKLEHDNLIKR